MSALLGGFKSERCVLILGGFDHKCCVLPLGGFEYECCMMMLSGSEYKETTENGVEKRDYCCSMADDRLFGPLYLLLSTSYNRV